MKIGNITIKQMEKLKIKEIGIPRVTELESSWFRVQTQADWLQAQALI